MTLLIADETARVLRVPTPRVYALARQGILPCVRLGRQLRFCQHALDRWIEEGGQALPGGWRRNAQRGLSIKDATT
jgi:excisionase family DNA binding protein